MVPKDSHCCLALGYRSRRIISRRQTLDRGLGSADNTTSLDAIAIFSFLSTDLITVFVLIRILLQIKMLYYFKRVSSLLWLFELFVFRPQTRPVRVRHEGFNCTGLNCSRVETSEWNLSAKIATHYFSSLIGSFPEIIITQTNYWELLISLFTNSVLTFKSQPDSQSVLAYNFWAYNAIRGSRV